jgi:hypothetical protein
MAGSASGRVREGSARAGWAGQGGSAAAGPPAAAATCHGAAARRRHEVLQCLAARALLCAASFI